MKWISVFVRGSRVLSNPVTYRILTNGDSPVEHFKQLCGGKSKAYVWRYFSFRVNGSGVIFNKTH